MTVDLLIVRITVSAVYTLLGVVVLVAGPRAIANRAFATYVLASGLHVFFGFVVGPLRVPEVLQHIIFAAFYLSMAAAVVMLAIAFPERIRSGEGRAAKGAVLVAVLLFAIYALWLAPGVLDGFFGWTVLPLAALGISMAATTAATAFFAVRAARAPQLLPSYAVMSIAVFLPLGIASGSALGTTTWLSLFGALNILVAAFAWIVTALRVTSKRWPVAVAWIVMGGALAAQIASPVNGGRTAGWDATVIAVQVVAIAPLAYMILRGQVPGLETKVRWTVSRSTVAASFVAVFFIASEGAQILFGQGNEWVGLFAAGTLVFAIAPLQRAAERLAERAVPAEDVGAQAGHEVQTPTGLPVPDVRERNIFASAVRAALCDGPVTRAKEEQLAYVALELGIPHPQAVRILRNIEEGGEVG